MLMTLGWILFAGLPLVRSATTPAVSAPAAQPPAGRVSVWTDRDEPYARGEGAHVFLDVGEPAYVAVFRVDTDGRIRVLFPSEPWAATYVRDQREFEVTGGESGGQSFVVDDDPGMGYLFAVAAAQPFDFRSITRGDEWDYRVIDGGRIQGDPYVKLTDLAARLVPDGDFDYDVTPYYVEHRYDYPRFVCYDCHAYAGFDQWNPYGTPCTRYRVVIRDDARYYPYHYGGRNVVADRPSHPGPRFIFRDVEPGRPGVTRAEPGRRRADDPQDLGRTSDDVGGPGTVPAPGLSLRRREREAPPELAPARPLFNEGRRARGREDERADRPAGRERDDSAREIPEGLRPTGGPPRSTGEPELRRRRP
jgi:hypothetical protein